ncbi:MAG: DUF4433 domain-containing protein [Paludibacteraceae bacterium]|nr:DUF4433 domain-containing protein [Paludibacteraceae bacterium]
MKDFNISLDTAVDFLHKKGHKDVKREINARIHDDEYELLHDEFSHDKDQRKESDFLAMSHKEKAKAPAVTLPEFEQKKEEPVVIEPEKIQYKLIVGKIDLARLNNKKKKVAPKEEEKPKPVQKKEEPAIAIKQIGKIDLDALSKERKQNQTNGIVEQKALALPKPVDIEECWPLTSFAKHHGKLRLVNNLIKAGTFETYSALVFGDAGNHIEVEFSPSVGVLSAEDIIARKDQLQVNKITNGKYLLCTKVENALEPTSDNSNKTTDKKRNSYIGMTVKEFLNAEGFTADICQLCCSTKHKYRILGEEQTDVIMYYISLPRVFEEFKFEDCESRKLIGGQILVLSLRATLNVLAKKIDWRDLEIVSNGRVHMPKRNDSFSKEISQFEDYLRTNENWKKEQIDFAKFCRNLHNKVFPDWGCYKYPIDITINYKLKSINLKRYNGSFYIWQHFYHSFCNAELDYVPPYHIVNIKEYNDIMNNKYHFVDSIQEKIWEFIKRCGNDTLVIFGQGMWMNNHEAHNRYHFKHLLEIMQNEGFTNFSFNSFGEVTIQTTILKKIIILDVITSNESLRAIVKKLATFNHTNQHSVFTYISLFKEYDRDEMQLLINEKKRSISIQNRIEYCLRTYDYKKTDAERILLYLKNKNINCFYHFTDKRNLSSIISNGGLFSWQFCSSNSITIEKPGGDKLSHDLDKKYGLSDYIRLSFCDDHPMAFRLLAGGCNLILLKISPIVATLNSTLFSDINATDTNHITGDDYEFLKNIDLEATQKHYLSADSIFFKQHQAEVLVKTFIPLKYILNIKSPTPFKYDFYR